MANCRWSGNSDREKRKSNVFSFNIFQPTGERRNCLSQTDDTKSNIVFGAQFRVHFQDVANISADGFLETNERKSSTCDRAVVSRFVFTSTGRRNLLMSKITSSSASKLFRLERWNSVAYFLTSKQTRMASRTKRKNLRKRRKTSKKPRKCFDQNSVRSNELDFDLSCERVSNVSKDALLNDEIVPEWRRATTSIEKETFRKWRKKTDFLFFFSQKFLRLSSEIDFSFLEMVSQHRFAIYLRSMKRKNSKIHLPFVDQNEN